MKVVIWMLLLSIMIPFSSAFDITVFDENQEPVQRTHYKIISPDFTTLVFSVNNTISVDVKKGPVIITGDDRNTLGSDYIYQFSDPYFVGEIHFLPAATVRGTVYNAEGFIVPNSLLNVRCGQINYPAKTDEYGSFELDVSTGTCNIYAKSGEMQGVIEVTTNRGDLLLSEQIILEERIINKSILASVIIVIIVLAGIGYFVFRQYKKKPKKEKLSSRTRDVMQTLNEKETKVVEYLMQNNLVYQNKIIKELKIPKTSLVRMLESLKRKNIVELEKIGKTKRVKLTEWFLKK